MPTDVSIFFLGCAVTLLVALALIQAVLSFVYRSPRASRAYRLARAQEFTDRVQELGLTMLYVGRGLEVSRKQMHRYTSGKDAIPKCLLMALEQLAQNRQNEVLQFRQSKPALTVIRGGKS